MRLASSVTVALTVLLISLLAAPPAASYFPELTEVPAATATPGIIEGYFHESPAADRAPKNEAWRTVQVFEGKGNAVTPPFLVSGTSWSLGWEITKTADVNTAFIVHIFRNDKPYVLWQSISCTDSNEGKTMFPIHSENGEEFFLKVFASNSVSWTISIQDNSPEALRPAVEISHIHYRGSHYLRDTANCICYEVVEPDEYVAITNSGDRAQKMGGWTLKNLSKGYPTFTFPTEFVLPPGQTVLITTNEVYPDCEAWLKFGIRSPYCTKQLWFSFYFGPGDIWDNRTPDTAVLYDSAGREVSRKSYMAIGD